MSEATPVVFIVDDDKVIRASLSRALEMRGFTVSCYASGEEYLEAYDPTIPGCLVLDYGMPGMSGLDLHERLVRDGKCIPVIFITGHGGVPESVQAMKQGAIDFLEKPFRPEILIDRIRAAFELDAQARIDRQAKEAARARFDRLTEREREITEFLVTHPATTSSKDVARALDISPRTVDHHRSRILEKMEVRSVVELVDVSRSAGLFEG